MDTSSITINISKLREFIKLLDNPTSSNITVEKIKDKLRSIELKLSRFFYSIADKKISNMFPELSFQDDGSIYFGFNLYLYFANNKTGFYLNRNLLVTAITNDGDFLNACKKILEKIEQLSVSSQEKIQTLDLANDVYSKIERVQIIEDVDNVYYNSVKEAKDSKDVKKFSDNDFLVEDNIENSKTRVYN